MKCNGKGVLTKDLSNCSELNGFIIASISTF